jgi:serine/threonine-protein kinase
MKSLLPAFAFLAAAIAGADAQDFRLHRDAAFGTSALVPATWRKRAGDSNQPGARFVSPDGSARMAVWSVPDRGRPLRDYMREIARSGGVKVTYSPARPDWFVLSGYRGGAIFYAKVMRACGRLHQVALEYPTTQKRAFDALVTRVSRSLRANC